MRTFAFLVVALCALSSAHARDLPVDGSTAHVGGFNTPVEMSLTPAFLARAEAAAVTAHKLPYSNPFTGMCQSDETKVSIAGIPGSFCSPKCGPSSPCPADTHKGATAKGECVLQTPGSTSPSQCALICKPKPSGGDCPVGATCVPIQGLGICTYEPKAEAEAEDAAGTAEKQSELMEVKN